MPLLSPGEGLELAKSDLRCHLHQAMAVYYLILGENPLKVWGLTVKERLERLLQKRARPLSPDQELDPQDLVLVFRTDYLLDDRLVRFLLAERVILVTEEEGKTIPICASVPGALLREIRAFFEGKGPPPKDLPLRRLNEVSGAFFAHLRKFEPPFALKLTPETRAQVERRLYDWSYKGITDLVTKWLWPHPARLAVKLCVSLGLKPNHVTFLGFLLVLLAGYLFYEGRLGLGLLCAWLMTFLDTVDGKLARVTVTSSRLGHYFDHLIDLLHPPIWYILWGLGAQKAGFWSVPYQLSFLAFLIVSGYVLGRLVEGAFLKLFGFEIFCWRPIDSFFRLITARRNPCLLLLTGFFLAKRPDLGLLAVTFWTVVTSFFLLGRFLWALWQRRRRPLRPWLAEVERFVDHRLAIKWFTREAKVS